MNQADRDILVRIREAFKPPPRLRFGASIEAQRMYVRELQDIVEATGDILMHFSHATSMQSEADALDECLTALESRRQWHRSKYNDE